MAAKFALAELGVVQVLALQFGGATATLTALRAARSARTGGPGETVQRPSLRLPYVLGGMAVGWSA